MPFSPSATATFQFSRPPLHRSLSTNSSQSSNSEDPSSTLPEDDIHPIELVVQSIVGDSLDALSSQLESLQESQIILVGRLRMLERKLAEFESNISVVDTKRMVERIKALKAKLTGIIATLKIVEKRVKSSLERLE
ncbi:hypothetical protein DASC09_006850 [Saccharomycopsis crataegensis]|uniref:Biogenesis of lysosome-related organelles complex 1 subunit 7 n=1 Tax=Saccharomycopsis crataegensis TaxID=43959 RepID=A0AAV5QFX7_9ASCO|nr:hypothetical protein DASC09_006850 [Saccharomycopsis crataegensis]